MSGTPGHVYKIQSIRHAVFKSEMKKMGEREETNEKNKIKKGFKQAAPTLALRMQNDFCNRTSTRMPICSKPFFLDVSNDQNAYLFSKWQNILRLLK